MVCGAESDFSILLKLNLATVVEKEKTITEINAKHTETQKKLQIRNDELAKANAQFAAFFAKSTDLMRTALEAGGAVLVHCNSGANRSSSVVAGYMMLTQGKRFDEVMPIIFEKRPIVCPRYWQWLVAEVEPQAVAHRYAALR